MHCANMVFLFLFILAFLKGCISSPSYSATKLSMQRKINNITTGHLTKYNGDPFGPCSHAEPTWVCDTKQFCRAASNMHKDGCYFLPGYCSPQCYTDIIQLNNTDCMQHPSDIWLKRFAEKVRESAHNWNKTCDGPHQPQ
jgi:hypothetical protein